mgnify:CR=1 FL=1
MQLNSSQIGEVTELKCQTFLIEHGYNVLIPIGNYLPYDLVIEKNNKFTKIQCKHAVEQETGFKVYTKRETRIDGNTKKILYTSKDCDYFMTEYKNNFYIFPVYETNETRFWTVPPRNGCKSAKMAKDFLAENMLQII